MVTKKQIASYSIRNAHIARDTYKQDLLPSCSRQFVCFQSYMTAPLRVDAIVVVVLVVVFVYGRFNTFTRGFSCTRYGDRWNTAAVETSHCPSQRPGFNEDLVIFSIYILQYAFIPYKQCERITLVRHPRANNEGMNITHLRIPAIHTYVYMCSMHTGTRTRRAIAYLRENDAQRRRVTPTCRSSPDKQFRNCRICNLLTFRST